MEYFESLGDWMITNWWLVAISIILLFTTGVAIDRLFHQLNDSQIGTVILNEPTQVRKEGVFPPQNHYSASVIIQEIDKPQEITNHRIDKKTWESLKNKNKVPVEVTYAFWGIPIRRVTPRWKEAA